MNCWAEQTIQTLMALPAEIWNAEIEWIKAQAEVQRAKEALAIRESQLYLAGKIDGKNAETREAQLHSETILERGKIAEAEINAMFAKANLNMTMNKLYAYKAIARILGKEAE